MATTPPLNKFLVSTDKKTRDKAIKNVAAFLSQTDVRSLSEHEQTKLWKGIFYCFWMSDKPLIQQALASELAELALTIKSAPSSLTFLRGFWEMTVREWSGIDRLRIDKYYMLIRRFTNAGFRFLMREEWNESACNEYNTILTKTGGPLCPDDIRVPTSLAYHLADIYLEELDKSFANSPTPSPLPVPLRTMLQPLFMLATRSNKKTTYQRIHSSLFEPFLSALDSPSSDESPASKRPRLERPTYSNLISNACVSHPREEGALGIVQLKAGFLKCVFDFASDEGTRDAQRRQMYALWRENADQDDGSEG